MSDAGSFVVSQETEAGEPVDLASNGPVSKEQAVALLNASLKKQGCGVTCRGRILTVVDLNQARTADLEVVTGNDPEEVAKSDEMVTQIIPVHYANASQLVNNLQPLLPKRASLSVNERANALILVTTGTDIRRMLKIIRALDNAIARVTSLKVFPLRYADAKDLAAVVQQLFASATAAQGARGLDGPSLFNPLGSGDMGPPGAPQLPGAAAGSDGADAAATGASLTAVADERGNNLIVCASPGLLASVAEVVRRLDRRVGDGTELRVFRLRNADPRELEEQLGQLFPQGASGTSGESEAGFSFGESPQPGDGPPEAGTVGLQSDTSQRQTKRGRVLTVADPRSSSLVVSAASGLMPQIATLIEKLDSDLGRKEVIGFWELRNADPQDVKQVLQCLFNRNVSAQNDSSALLGHNNSLTARQSKQQTTAASGAFSLGNSGTSAAPSSGGGDGF